MIRSLRIIGACIALGALVACSSASTSYDPQPVMTFSHIEPVRLLVNDVQVISRFQSPLRAPNIEHELDTSPESALRQWAQAKFQPALSGDHQLRVTIRDAAVKKEEIDTDSGITSFFTDEQKFRYTATADVMVEVYRGSALSRLAWIEARAVREMTTPESTSLRDRDDALFGMTEALIKEIDTKTSEATGLHFAPFIVR